MAKKKVQRTDWKKEFHNVVVDRNHFQMRSDRLEREAKEAECRLDGRLHDIERLKSEAREVGRRLKEVEDSVKYLLIAPEQSSTDGEKIEHGREVVLGMLLERLRNIERPVPF